MIRNLTPEDLPGLARLRTSQRPAAGAEERKAETALTELFPRLFFDSPWSHPELPSLVSEDSNGNADGMIAVAARPVCQNGRRYTAAIGADLYVAPQSRSGLNGFILLKTFLNGPQDLTICDIANRTTRRLWERMGGIVAPAYNLNWIGVFRPTQLVASLLRGRRGFGIAGSAAGAIAPAIDRILPGRLRCNVPALDSSLVEEELGPVEFSHALEELTSEDSLQPVYDRYLAEWTWRRLPFLSPDPGNIAAVLLRDRRRNLLGWYIYKLAPGGIARVLQIAARPVNAAAVVDHLFSRLHAEGGAAVAGRLQPRFLQLLIDRGAMIRPRSTYMLVHSRNEDLLDSFRHGTAWLSLLDGEAPVNVWNSPRAAVDALDGLNTGVWGADSDKGCQSLQLPVVGCP
jgi:hypothetical protein